MNPTNNNPPNFDPSKSVLDNKFKRPLPDTEKTPTDEPAAKRQRTDDPAPPIQPRVQQVAQDAMNLDAMDIDDPVKEPSAKVQKMTDDNTNRNTTAERVLNLLKVNPLLAAATREQTVALHNRLMEAGTLLVENSTPSPVDAFAGLVKNEQIEALKRFILSLSENKLLSYVLSKTDWDNFTNTQKVILLECYFDLTDETKSVDLKQTFQKTLKGILPVAVSSQLHQKLRRHFFNFSSLPFTVQNDLRIFLLPPNTLKSYGQKTLKNGHESKLLIEDIYHYLKARIQNRKCDFSHPSHLLFGLINISFANDFTTPLSETQYPSTEQILKALQFEEAHNKLTRLNYLLYNIKSFILTAEQKNALIAQCPLLPQDFSFLEVEGCSDQLIISKDFRINKALFESDHRLVKNFSLLDYLNYFRGKALRGIWNTESFEFFHHNIRIQDHLQQPIHLQLYKDKLDKEKPNPQRLLELFASAPNPCMNELQRYFWSSDFQALTKNKLTLLEQFKPYITTFYTNFTQNRETVLFFKESILNCAINFTDVSILSKCPNVTKVHLLNSDFSSLLMTEIFKYKMDEIRFSGWVNSLPIPTQILPWKILTLTQTIHEAKPLSPFPLTLFDRLPTLKNLYLTGYDLTEGLIHSLSKLKALGCLSLDFRGFQHDTKLLQLLLENLRNLPLNHLILNVNFNASAFKGIQLDSVETLTVNGSIPLSFLENFPKLKKLHLNLTTLPLLKKAPLPEAKGLIIQVLQPALPNTNLNQVMALSAQLKALQSGSKQLQQELNELLLPLAEGQTDQIQESLVQMSNYLTKVYPYLNAVDQEFKKLEALKPAQPVQAPVPMARPPQAAQPAQGPRPMPPQNLNPGSNPFGNPMPRPPQATSVLHPTSVLHSGVSLTQAHRMVVQRQANIQAGLQANKPNVSSAALLNGPLTNSPPRKTPSPPNLGQSLTDSQPRHGLTESDPKTDSQIVPNNFSLGFLQFLEEITLTSNQALPQATLRSLTQIPLLQKITLASPNTFDKELFLEFVRKSSVKTFTFNSSHPEAEKLRSQMSEKQT